MKIYACCDECRGPGPCVTIGQSRQAEVCEVCLRAAVVMVAAPVVTNGAVAAAAPSAAREVTCYAQVSPRGVEVVVSGVPRVVPPTVLRECLPHVLVDDGDAVCVKLDEMGQIVGIEHAEPDVS